MTDEQYMKIAIELAQKGVGFVNPNPLVGAVIVKDGKIIGQGYHEKYGEFHAERNAIKNCEVSPKGGTMYVSLEPCCHHGKTPPCTDAIIESGITKVVVGAVDPNPLMAGKGIEKLKEHGIEVITDVIAKEASKQNEVFFHYINKKTPYVVMKYAMTIDGKIATHTGESKWITGEEARYNVHKDRHKYTAIMVGVGTVIADDPLLNCRIENCKDPIRIICDTNLRMDLDSQIVKTAKEIPTIIATACVDEEKIKKYTDKSCKVITVARRYEHIDLSKLMIALGEMNIDSILLEGGSMLNWSALKSGIVNKVQAYIAPKIFGGITSKTPIGGTGVDLPEDAFFLENSTITMIGQDILIESEIK